MESAGMHVWGLTPQNEPEAVQHNFESCAWRPQDQADFVVQHLGPALARAGHGNLTLMGYDHNKVDSLTWAQALLGNSTVRQFVNAFAVHWCMCHKPPVTAPVFQLSHPFPTHHHHHHHHHPDDYGDTLGLDNVAAIRALLGPDAILLNTEACYLESLIYDWRVSELYAADIMGDLNFGANGWHVTALFAQQPTATKYLHKALTRRQSRPARPLHSSCAGSSGTLCC